MPDGSPAMVAAMRAGTCLLLVEVEQLAGDARAEALALGEVAACRAEARRLGPGDRADERCREACDAWLQRLCTVADAELLTAAGVRIAEHLAGDAEGLVAAAKRFGAFVQRHADAERVRAAGTTLLQRAEAAGADRSRFAADADLQSLLVASGH